jgi:hypothetical protein
MRIYKVSLPQLKSSIKSEAPWHHFGTMLDHKIFTLKAGEHATSRSATFSDQPTSQSFGVFLSHCHQRSQTSSHVYGHTRTSMVYQ